MRFKVERLGEAVEGVRIKGDPLRPEPEAFRIVFPFGFVEVTRAVDGDPNTDYWVHVYVNNPLNKSYCCEIDGLKGQIKHARLDQVDKHTSDCNLGDFARAELYHLAVRVGAISE